MLTVRAASRLVVDVAPDLAAQCLAAWRREARRLSGEPAEVAALLRPLVDGGRLTLTELSDLGMPERSEAGVLGFPAVVLRRHIRVAADGIDADDEVAARTLVDAGPRFSRVVCSEAQRARSTALLWSESVVVEARLNIDDDTERRVGTHAGFGAWTEAPRPYLDLIGGLIGELLGSSEDGPVLAITHDGIPQAVVAALGLELTSGRRSALGHLEGVVIGELGGRTSVWRVGGPPTDLLRLQ